MNSLGHTLRTRIAPVVLTAAGVTLVAAGLLTYTNPVTAGPLPSSSPAPSVVVSSTPAPFPSLALPSSQAPSLPPIDRLATRVVVPALRIDLPVIRQPDPSYPACNVAMYIEQLGQPGQGRATYLYAHARQGMFLPILNASTRQNGKAMIGMLVEVYTTDDQRFLYEVTEVRRHQTTLDDAAAAKTEQLWLQTSEGPRGTPGKTQIVARALSVGPVDPAAAHPTPKPVDCS